MNAQEPQPVPMVLNEGKNRIVPKNGQNPPVYVIRQPAAPPPAPPKVKSQ
ncbi:MAG: hypothetical protein LBJ41_03640 [Treponema sp.]|jgi:hypothetical protein|nr:hypothetical protein [Treponema sp.]